MVAEKGETDESVQLFRFAGKNGIAGNEDDVVDDLPESAQVEKRRFRNLGGAGRRSEHGNAAMPKRGGGKRALRFDGTVGQRLGPDLEK